MKTLWRKYCAYANRCGHYKIYPMNSFYWKKWAKVYISKKGENKLPKNWKLSKNGLIKKCPVIQKHSYEHCTEIRSLIY